MKYKITVYGPFGPKQTGRYATHTFDTATERNEYKEKVSGGMTSIIKVWED